MLASKGVFAKQLYALGVDFETVAATRAVLAIPGFVIIAILSGSFRRDVALQRPHAVAAMAAGLVCYYLGSMANFYALTLIDASVERALLFTYPALVVLLGVLLGLEPLRKSTLAALLATFSGIALVMGVDSTDGLDTDLTGALWVFFCASTIAIYFMVNAYLSPKMGSAMFTLLAMGAAGAAFAVHYELRHGWFNLSVSGEAWIWLAGLILVATILPLSLISEGLRSIGSRRGAFASTIGPPAAVVMAVIFLDEEITRLQFLGILVVVGSIVYLEILSRRNSDPSM